MSFSNLHRGIHVSGDTFFTDVRARRIRAPPTHGRSHTRRGLRPLAHSNTMLSRCHMSRARPPRVRSPDTATMHPRPHSGDPVALSSSGAPGAHRYPWRAKIVCRRPRGLTDVRFPLPPHRRDSWLAYRPSPPLRSPGTRRNSGGRPPFAPTSERRLDGARDSARDGARDRRTSSGAL